ncbi:MAG: glycosyltransferase [Bacteroidetes bacterium]|nr:glycosyltransferase [Bacteroidota bacterium]
MKSDIFFIIPSYFDGKATSELIKELQTLMKSKLPRVSCYFIIVDDSAGLDKSLGTYSSKSKIRRIKTRGQIGNQRAIITGLKTVLGKVAEDSLIVVMDGDGEDSPPDAIKMISYMFENSNFELVHAERGRRKAGLYFGTLLLIYRIIFRILTGSQWRAGNFSAFRASWLKKNFNNFESSKNFAGSIQAIKANREFIKFDRGPRRYGGSKTPSYEKILHALSSIGPWTDKIQVRSLIFLGFSLLNLISSVSLALYLKFTSNGITPNWFTIVFFSTFSLSMLALNVFLTTYILKVLYTYTSK